MHVETGAINIIDTGEIQAQRNLPNNDKYSYNTQDSEARYLGLARNQMEVMIGIAHNIKENISLQRETGRAQESYA